MDDDGLQALDRAMLRTRQTLLRQASPLSHMSALGPSESPLLKCRSPPPPRSPMLHPLRKFSLDDEEFSLEDDGPLTVTQAVFNLANTIVGVGVLSVPYAFKQSGYFTLLIIMLVIFITDTTGKWIGSSIKMAGNTKEAEAVPPNARDFAFIAQTAFGRWGRRLINFVTIFEVWFACVTFMIMNGGNAKVVWPSVPPALTVPVTGLISTVFCLIPEECFSYLSLISTLSLMVAAIAMVTATWMLSSWAEPYQKLGDSALINPSNIPQSVGIILFCFAGHPVFPSVYSSMKEPTKWNQSVDISFLLAFLFYGSLGFVGYIVFGSGLDATVTENLTGIPGTVALACQNIAALGFLVKVQLTAPLLLNALMVALWPPAAGQPEWPLGRLLLLAGVGTVTVLVSVAFRDSVAAVAGFSGSFCVMLTSVLFPAAAHLALSCSSPGSERPKARAYLTYAGVMLFGSVMAVLGTASAVRDLAA